MIFEKRFLHRILRSLKVIFNSLFLLIKLFLREIYKVSKLFIFFRTGPLEKYVNDFSRFTNEDAWRDKRKGNDLFLHLRRDLSLRNALWKEANAFYIQSNWSSARSKLEIADQVQEEAARRIAGESTRLRFLGSSITNHIGHMAISMGTRARLRILGESTQSFLVISSRSANDSLLESWEKFFPVLRVSNTDASIIESNLWPLFDHVQTVRTSKGVLDLITAHNRYARAYEVNNHLPLLTISKELEDRAKDKFSNWGWDPNGWFVTMHIREDKDNFPGYGRNSNPENYLPAIRAIIGRGGNVVRIGNPGMSALPPLDGFMDLSQYRNTEDWLDLFLMANCKFFIGTTSGPLIVPTLFGTRILATNAPDLGKFVYLPKGILLPKRVRTESGSLLSLDQQLKSPAGSTDAWLGNFDGQRIQWEENSPIDILDAVEEMFSEDVAGLGSMQKHAFEMILQAGASDSTPIAKSFLSNHPDFLN